MAEISVGAAAPDAALELTEDRTVRLSDLRGRAIVLFFYPQDDSTSCTAEAQAFSALAPAFREAGVELIGVSPDSFRSHEKFKAKRGLDLQLAADPDRHAIDAFGLWVEKKMYGRTFMGVERATFLIDREGRVAQQWRNVKVKGHAEAVLEAARAL